MKLCKTELKSKLESLSKTLKNNKISIDEKIKAIDIFHKETNSNIFESQLKVFKDAQSVLVNRKKVSNKLTNTEKQRVESSDRISFDGETFILVPADSDTNNRTEYKIFHIESGKFVAKAKIGTKKTELNKIFDSYLRSIPTDNLSVNDRIIQKIRELNPLKDDGSIPFIRTMFRSKKGKTLFTEHENPFMNKNLEPKERLKQIIKYIPKAIKDVIIGNDKEKMDELELNFQSLLHIMEKTNIAKEKVFKIQYKLNEKGEFVPINNTLYKQPNYLYLLGHFKEVISENENSLIGSNYKYYELVLDPQVEEVIRFYTANALSEMKSLDLKLNAMSIDDIAKDFNLSYSDAEKMKEFHFANGHIPLSIFMQSIAKDAFDQLGIKVNKNIDIEIQNGIISSINAMIRSTLLNSDFVFDVNSEEYITNLINDRIKNITINDNDSEEIVSAKQSVINTVISDIKEIYNGKLNEQKYFKINYDALKLNDTDISEFAFKAINKLKYISNKEKRGFPTLTPQLPSQLMMKSNYKMNNDNYQFVKDQSFIKWNFNSNMENLYKLYKKNKLLALKKHGYIDNFDSFQHDEIKQVKTENERIEREMDYLIELYENKEAKNDGFYIPWGQTISGRPTIISDINPQESKLHRSFIQQSGHTTTLNKKDLIENGLPIEFKAALAQAFDLDPDKKSEYTVNDDLNNLIKVTDSGIEILGSNELSENIRNILSAEKEEDLAEYYNNIFYITEGHHGIQAVDTIIALDKWLKSDTKEDFKNDLTIETDAITSGMMLTLMQILDEKSIELLSKGGIYTEKTYNKWSKYTKKLIAQKYNLSENEVKFTPSALIEAGVYHNELLEKISSQEIDNSVNKEFSDFILKHEIFNDLYKTVGMEMKNSVNSKKDNLKKEFELIESQLNTVTDDSQKYRLEIKKAQISATIALLDTLGDITPQRLRFLAKDPVMVYVYGATIESIKKKLANSFGKNQLIKSIKTLKKIQDVSNGDLSSLDDKSKKEYTIASKFILAFLDFHTLSGGSFQFAEYKNDVEQIIDITDEKYSNASYIDNLMHLKITEPMIQNIKKLTDDTFGSSISEAFRKTFKSVDEYRDKIKSIELVTFELFKARLDVQLEKIKEKKVITKNDIDRLLKIFINEGYGHDMPTNHSYGTENYDALPMYKMDSKSDNKSASFVFKFDDNLQIKENETIEEFKKRVNTQYRMHALLENLNYIANTGASSTMSIHKLDGTIMVKTIGDNPYLSIYDAIVQAANRTNIDEMSNKYNENTIYESFNYNVLENNMKKLLHMFNNLQERMNNKNENISKDAKKEYNKIKDRFILLSDTKIINKESASKKSYIPFNTSIKIIEKTGERIFVFNEKDKKTTKYLYTDSIKYKVDNITKTIYQYKNSKNQNNISKIRIEEQKDNSSEINVTEYYRIESPKNRNNEKTIYSYKIEYTYTVGNDPLVQVDEKGNPVPFEINAVITSKLNEGFLPDVISSIEAKQELKESNSDIVNDINRLGLDLPYIIERFENINEFIKNRLNSMKQTYFSGHSGTTFTEPIQVNNFMNNTVFSNYNIENILSFLKDIQKASYLSNMKYITSKLEDEKNNFKNVTKFSELISVAKDNTKNGNIFVLSNESNYDQSNSKIDENTNAEYMSENQIFNRIFDYIHKVNPKKYSGKDTVIVNYNKNRFFNKDGINDIVNDKLEDIATSGSDIIINDFNDLIIEDEYKNKNLYKRDLANYQYFINYIKSKGYNLKTVESNGKNIIVFNKIEINDTIKQKYTDLNTLIEKMNTFLSQRIEDEQNNLRC